MNKKQLEELEEQAFYESGLSADGCLDNLDTYARQAIQKYGRILINYLLNQEAQKIILQNHTNTVYTFTQLNKHGRE